MWPNAAAQWRAAQEPLYETEMLSARPLKQRCWISWSCGCREHAVNTIEIQSQPISLRRLIAEEQAKAVWPNPPVPVKVAREQDVVTVEISKPTKGGKPGQYEAEEVEWNPTNDRALDCGTLLQPELN
jgi:hypothetical protein